jgi:hypothetical protein
MKWDDAELSSIASIVAALDADTGPRETSLRANVNGKASTSGRTRVVRLRASAADRLKAGCCGHKSLIVRHLYRALGFDEHRLFQHRLEHKLVQALVLHHYCPGVVPVTRGVRRELEGVEPAAMQAHLDRVCSAEGALIKHALGYGSGERKQIEAMADCVNIFGSGSSGSSGSGDSGREATRPRLHDEVFVLQQRVEIDTEYRVHTVEGRVAPELTYRRYGWGVSPDEREAPNAFVQRVIDRLPNGFVRGAIVAWDVAKTHAHQGHAHQGHASQDHARQGHEDIGGLVVIEANLAGYHPVFEPGFQCSGFFQGPWGPALVARLFQFVEQTYGVKVRVHVDVPADAIEHDVYWWSARWHDLFRIAGGVGSLSDAFDRVHDARRPAPDDAYPQDRRAFITLLSRLEHVSRALMSLA